PTTALWPSDRSDGRTSDNGRLSAYWSNRDDRYRTLSATSSGRYSSVRRNLDRRSAVALSFARAQTSLFTASHPRTTAMNMIDLNCDMGESFGAWQMGADAEVFAHITSANIACGFHAGDPLTMQATVNAAIEHGVAIGAHPSLPDLQGFGRREMRISAAEAYALVMYQMGALSAFAQTRGARVTHIKPHGALYNMAARDVVLAGAIASAVHAVDPRLILVGLANSELPRAGERFGLRVAHEGFADRRYCADGSLSPRSAPGSVINDVELAI